MFTTGLNLKALFAMNFLYIKGLSAVHVYFSFTVDSPQVGKIILEFRHVL